MMILKYKFSKIDKNFAKAMFEDNNVEMVARAWFELESQKQQEISE